MTRRHTDAILGSDLWGLLSVLQEECAGTAHQDCAHSNKNVLARRAGLAALVGDGV